MKSLFLLLFCLTNVAWSQDFSPLLYSLYGEELQVHFQATYRTQFSTVEEMLKNLPDNRMYFLNYTIEPTIKYLFGPLTQRGWGGIKKNLSIVVDWDHPQIENGKVELNYSYTGIWLLDLNFLDRIQTPVPLPYNTTEVFTPGWKKCTDSHHDSESFYWYYWDPSRPQCDHQEGKVFQNILLQVSAATNETKLSYPEYKNMIVSREGKLVMPITFAFGYYEEPSSPNPDNDSDVGAREYQKFIQEVRRLIPNNAKETLIKRSEYPQFYGSDFVIGHRFQFVQDNVEMDVSILMNAGVDQIVLFAESFAKRHDSYFGWLGHSRVGSGFDATRFGMLLRDQPQVYSLTPNYQLIYWGGCNSYSYYTEPFFKFKSGLRSDDPNGTKALDIVANALPSFFALNSANGLIHFKALLNWSHPTSYQSIISDTEKMASYFGTRVLSIVLGDEDNSVSF